MQTIVQERATAEAAARALELVKLYGKGETAVRPGGRSDRWCDGSR